MAEEHQNKSHEYEAKKVGDEGNVEAKDRGLFDFLGKKEEEKKPDHQEEVITTGFEKVKVSESSYEVPKHKEEEHKVEAEKKPSLLEKLHRSDSSSSSSSDEEEGEGEVKKKEKKKKERKGLKEKISGEGEEKKKQHEDTSVPIERYDEPSAQPEEKKGFIEKIKEKLPGGQHKKTEDAPPPPPPVPVAPTHHEYPADSAAASHEGEAGEEGHFGEDQGKASWLPLQD